MNLRLCPALGAASSSISFDVDTSASSFTLDLGAGDSLTVDDLSSASWGTAQLNIDSSAAANVIFAGNVTDSAGINVNLGTAAQSLANNYSNNEWTVGSGSSAAETSSAITVDPSVTLSANTITLDAQASSTLSISTGSSDTSVGIYTQNRATVEIEGTLQATGTDSSITLGTDVVVSDTVNAAGTDGESLTAITVEATDTSTVTLVSGASITADSVDITATTAVTSTITADDLAYNYLVDGAAIAGPLVEITTAVDNTTEVSVPIGASITAEGGTVAGTGGANQPPAATLVISATDTTDITSDFQPADTYYLPIINGVNVFSLIDSQVALDRTTDVLIGDTEPNLTGGQDTHDSNTISTPATNAADAITSDGLADIGAASNGSIVNNETSAADLSSSTGSTENYAEGFTLSNGAITFSSDTDGDTTVVEIRGVNVDADDAGVGGLDVTALNNTSYFASSHYATNTIFGEVDTLVDHSNITAGSSGVSVESEIAPTAAVTALGQSYDINTENIIGIDSTTFTVTATSAVSTLDEDVSAQVTGLSTITSAGAVLLQALNSAQIVSYTDTESVDITTGPLPQTEFSFAGTFSANEILGQTIASINSSTVTTTTANTAGSPNVGDIQVLAGNTAVIDAEAQAGSTATGGKLAAGAAGAIAVNAIGVSGATATSLSSAALATTLSALEEVVNGLLGTGFWTTPTPSNTTASIIGSSIGSSTVDAAGALVLMAVGAATINATISNVSDITGTSISGSTAGAAGGAIATNKVYGTAQAFIAQMGASSQPSISAGGSTLVGTSSGTPTTEVVPSVTVEAQNNDTINSNSTIVTDASGQTDGAVKLASEALDDALKLAGVATDQSSTAGTATLYYGDTVQFDATYTTARSLFAPLTTNKDVTLQTGDTVYVEKGYDPDLGVVGQTYVYTGSQTIQNFNLEDANYLDTANWAVANGQEGAIYEFMGPSQSADPAGTVVTLGTGVAASELNPAEAALGYANLNWWYEEPYSQLLPSGYNIKTASAIAIGGIVVDNDVSGGAIAYINNSTVTAGALSVTANDNAAITANVNATASVAGGSVFGDTGGQSSTVLAVNAAIATNQVIGAATAYITGSTITTMADTTNIVPLTDGDVVQLSNGSLYEYVGSAGDVDLLNTTYTNGALWKAAYNATNSATANSVSLDNRDVVQLGANYDTVTPGDVFGSGTPGTTVTQGEVIQVGSTLYRYLGNTSTTLNFSEAPSAFTPSAEWAQIGGTEGALYQYIGPSGGSSRDLNNTDYTNTSLWQLVTTTIAQAPNADVDVSAVNSNSITATTASSTTVGGNGTGTAVGIVLAFNAIGDAFNNLLSNTVDAILDQTVLGTVEPDITAAYITDSTVTSAGGINVTATSTETVNSTITDNTTDDAAAFANASGTTVDGLVTGNVIKAGVQAYIDNTSAGGTDGSNDPINAANAITVTATDNSSDTSTSSETSINTPSNDGGAGLINGYANLVLASYQYTDESGVVGLNFGDKVWVSGVTAGDIVDQGSANTTVNNGDVAEDAEGNFWQYTGSSSGNYNFSAQGTPNFNDGNWTEIATGPGITSSSLPSAASLATIYEYMGPGGTTNSGGVAAASDNVNLSTGAAAAGNSSTNTGYQPGAIDIEYWKALSQNNIVQAAEIDVELGIIGEVTDNEDIQGNANGYFGLLDFNEVQSSTLAYVQDVTIGTLDGGAGGLDIDASDTASITASDASTVTAGSAGGNNGGGQAFGGLIATNQVDGDASAYIVDSNITTASGDDVDVTASTSASIGAFETSSLSAGGNTGSILAAFNVVGWSNDNFAYLLLGTLIGDTNLLGSQTPDLTQAYIENSTVASGGNVNVTATDTAAITVDAGDAANTSQGNNLLFAFEDGDPGISADGLLATNMIAAQTNAYITQNSTSGSTTVSAAAGSVNVTATDTSSDTATSALNVVATNSNNEQDIISILDQLFTTSYAYTSASGWQNINDGDEVLDNSTPGSPAIYTYKGTPGLVDLTSGMTFSSNDWTKQTEGEPTLAGELAAFGQFNLTASNATGLGGIFVMNEVQSQTTATVTGASLTASDAIDVAASESAAITAFVENNVTASGGSAGLGLGEGTTNGGSLAADGSLVTNLVDASATAYIDRSLTTAATYSTTPGSESADNVPPYTNVVNLADGDAVTLGSTYGAVTGNDVVGSGSATATINPGDVVQNGSSFYRYIADAATTLDLASGGPAINFNTSSWAQVGGTPGATYIYVGAPGDVDIYNTNFNSASWQAATYATTPSSGVHHTVTVAPGATVQLASNYAVVKPGDVVGFGAANTTVDPGDVIEDGSTLYRYIGSTSTTVDFARGATGLPTFATNANWAQIGGSSGAVYRYVGQNSASVDLNNTNYNTANWQLVSSTSTTPGPNPPGTNLVALTPGATVQLASNYDTVTQGDVVGVGSANTIVNNGDVIQDGSTLYRYIGPASTTVDFSSGGTPPNFAADTTDWAQIGGTNGAIYRYAGTAANIDLNNTNYTSTGWSLVTPTYVSSQLSAGSGGISVVAINAAQLDAQALVASATSGGGDQETIGAILAFNALGYDPENVLFNSIDALLGDDYLADADPSNATAYIHDTYIGRNDAGDLDVEATSSEQINATNSNAANTTASALFDATGNSYAFSLASNKVDGSATAYIDETDLTGTATQVDIVIGGSVNVLANNDAGIYSNVKLVSSSTVTNDGGAGLLQNEINQSTPATFTTAPDSVLFPNNSSTNVTRTLAFGDTVMVDNGAADGLPAYDAVTSGSAADGTSLPDIVGSGAPGTTVNPGDVVEDASGNLYRYVGQASATYDFAPQASTDVPNFNDGTTWTQIGGTPGTVYEYMGPAGSVNLATQNYTNEELWKPLLTTQLIPQGLNVSDSNTTAAGAIAVLNEVISATTAYVNNVNITTGQNGNSSTTAGTITISAINNATLSANNNTTVSNSGGRADGQGTEWSVNGIIATNVVQSSASAYAQSSTLTSYSHLYVLGSGGSATLKPGDVVEENPSSAPADFATDSGNGSTDIHSLVAGETVQLNSNYGTATDVVGSSGNDVTVNPGDVVQNGNTLYRYVGSTAQAYDLTGNVDDTTAADPSPNFSDATTWAQIGGTAGALYEYIGAGSASAPAQIDLNNTDYTNTANWQLVQPALYRYVGSAPLTNFSLAQGATLPQFSDTTQWVQIGQATISIYATNTSTITADNQANTSSGGNGAGVVLAFNTLGWQSQNFYFNALDAILGSPDYDEAFGSSPLADVTAYASNSTLDAVHGSISVEGLEQATIFATTGNVSASLASGLIGESSSSYGALIATNMVNAQATAYITSNSTTTAGGGGLSVIANDDAEITSDDNMEISSTSQSSPQGLLLSYLGNIINDYQFTSASGTQTVDPGDVVYDNGTIYEYTPTNQLAAQLDLGDYNQTTDPTGQEYATSPNWTAVTYTSLAGDIPEFNLTNSNAEAAGAIFVLNDVRSTVAATVTGGTLNAAGALLIDAENNAVIDADNTSTIIASGGSPIAGGDASAYNVTIASNYVLASTVASATDTSLNTTVAGADVDVTALDNASIDAEMDASAFADNSTYGIVLAFNTIGFNEPIGGFFENTVDALFGTDLSGPNPDLVEAYTSDTSISSDGGVAVTANDTANITSDVSNSSLGVPPFLTGHRGTSVAAGGGVSVGATIAYNAVDTDVQAYVTQDSGGSHSVSSAGDIDIESSDVATITSTVVTPVVKIGIDFSNSSASAIGISIARNIIDSNVSANDGGRVIGTDPTAYDTGLDLTASNGNINITASDTSAIASTSATAAVAVSIGASAGGVAGGGAVAVNTILGSVIADVQGVALSASGSSGNVTISATDNRRIVANVAALSADASLGDAVALGAAVALNLIGWNGTVADETEDAQQPIMVQANVDGGSITASGTVSITATSESSIHALTAAVAVAIGISLTGGGDSGEEGEGGAKDSSESGGETGNVEDGEGGSSTSAEEEGEGKTSDGEGEGETTTDEGQADGATVDEGADNNGGAETNEAEEGGAAAGDTENESNTSATKDGEGNNEPAQTGQPAEGEESGAQKGSVTTVLKGLGQGGGLLVGLGGVVNSSQAGNAAAPTYTTNSGTANGQNVVNSQALDYRSDRSARCQLRYGELFRWRRVVDASDRSRAGRRRQRHALSLHRFRRHHRGPVDRRHAAGFHQHQQLGADRRHGRGHLRISRSGQHARSQQPRLHQRRAVDRYHWRHVERQQHQRFVGAGRRRHRHARRRSWLPRQRRILDHPAIDQHRGGRRQGRERRHRSGRREQSCRTGQRNCGSKVAAWRKRERR